MKYLTPALALLLTANVAFAVSVSDDIFNGAPQRPQRNAWIDETPWQETATPLVTYPADFAWVAVSMPDTIKQSVFIDRQSLQIGSDGVVRFSLRQLSPKGAENISREGVQCQARSFRSYAFADTTNKRWIEASRAQWQKLSVSDLVRRTLLENLCPGNIAPRSTEEILANLNKTVPQPERGVK